MVYLGIDGGASKTRGVLVASDGRVIARARGRGSSIVGTPSPRSRGVLAGLVRALLRRAGVRPRDVARTGLGLNGVDFAREFAVQHGRLARALGVPRSRLVLVNDGIVALWGATPDPAAVLIQHGSGFTAAYRRHPGGERLFDHLAAGRPFDLRFEVLPFVARQLDGREPVTGLVRRVLGFVRVPASGYAEALFRGTIPWSRMRLLCPVVYRAWADGDTGAAKLVRRAADDYALAAVAMIRKTGSRRPFVGLGGGQIDTAPDALHRLVAARVRSRVPGARVGRPALPPEVGAALMAAYADGVEPGQFFRRVARLAGA